MLLEREAAQLSTQAKAAEQLLYQEFNLTHEALRVIREALPAWQIAPNGGETYAQRHLLRVRPLMPYVRAFHITDAQGTIVLSTRTEAIGDSLLDRAHFASASRAQSLDLLDISTPYLTRGNTWTMSLTLPLLDPGGNFQGILTAVLEPNHFLAAMESMRYSPSMTVSLVHDSGSLYVSTQDDLTLGPLTGPMAKALKHHLASQQTHNRWKDCPTDGGPELICTVQTVNLSRLGGDHNLVVMSSRDHESILKDWKRESLYLLALNGLLVVASAAMLRAYQIRTRTVIEQQHQHQQELIRHAYHDALTGAFNRRAILDGLDAELARIQRGAANACVVMMDIDHFKSVNDTHGHEVGDLALQHLVNVTQSQLRRMDTLGRLGGEEFTLLLPDTSLEGGVHLAERVREALQTHTVPLPDGDQAGLRITVSLGVSVLTAQDSNAHVALKRSDEALYRAKSQGRNRVCVNA